MENYEGLSYGKHAEVYSCGIGGPLGAELSRVGAKFEPVINSS